LTADEKTDGSVPNDSKHCAIFKKKDVDLQLQILTVYYSLTNATKAKKVKNKHNGQSDSNVPAIKAEKRLNLRAKCGLGTANCAIEKGSGSQYPFAGSAVELVSNMGIHTSI
jgi:hypothetical protein